MRKVGNMLSEKIRSGRPTIRSPRSRIPRTSESRRTTSQCSVSGISVDALPSGVAAGCYVANESWLPEVEITGTKVGVTRARGFLLQTDRPVTIADCTFENTRLAGILCAPGASWGEMGPVNGVTVTNCTFRGCGGRVATEDSCMVRLRSCDNAKVVFNTAYGGGFTNDVYRVSGNTNIEAHDNGFRDESETPVPVGTAL